ncbi:MAG: TRAP transporter substrate-binding protein [Myxococcota bacterium]
MPRLFLLALLAAGSAFADPVVAKLATVAPDGTPWSESLKAFKDRVEKGSEGRIRVKPYLGGALGDENVTASETKRGAIQIWGGSTGALATLVPELALFELPYLFRSEKEADHVIDEVLFEDVKKLLASRGFVLLFFAENGYRSFGTTFGPVKTPAALKGKKMRSQESDVHIEMYRSFGASPVPIAVTEVLSSLQTKVVDGFDNTPLFTFAASWYQGVTDFTLVDAIYQPGIVVANKAWFDKLDPKDQALLLADAKGEAQRGRKAVRELAPLLLDNFKNAGIKVHLLSEDEKNAFAALAEKSHDKWLSGKGKAAAPLVKKAKAALDALRKNKKK